MELSVESARKRLETLNSQEYIELGRGYDYGYDTDWYHQLTRNNPFSHRHSVTMTGGTKALQLYSSLSYSDQKGIVIGDGRIKLRFVMLNASVPFSSKKLHPATASI